MSRFSSVAYSLLPSSPTKSTTFTKTEQSNNGSHHSNKHSRSQSLNAIGSSSSSRKRGNRRRTVLLTTVALIAGAGLFYTLRHQSRTASPDVQFDHRHRIAVDFETTDVPEEWSCNPFKEPGRMLSDDTNAVSCLLLRYLVEDEELIRSPSYSSSRTFGNLTTKIVGPRNSCKG